ncbi:hypothetical protein [Lactobacillus intestinalis]|nr:hypothetical protein [Lactobacillus intestinalis]
MDEKTNINLNMQEEDSSELNSNWLFAGGIAIWYGNLGGVFYKPRRYKK